MKLLLLIIILIIGTVLSTAYLHEQGEALAVRTKGIKAVHDIVHEYCPDLSHRYRAYDWLLLIFVAPLVINLGKYDLPAFIYSFAWVIVPIMIFRCITVCSSIPTRTTNEIERDFGSWLKQHFTGASSDLCFSGHCSVALALILVMLRFKIIEKKVAWLSLFAAYGFFSTASRNHFTIDVLMCVPATLLFFDWTQCKSASKDLLWGGCQ